MSRIGKKPVPLPAGVTAAASGHTVTIKGPKGELTRHLHPELAVRVEGGAVLVAAGPSEIVAWDAASRKVLRTIAAEGAAVSPGGRYFAAREDGTIRLCGFSDGRLVRTLADRDFAAGEHALVWDGTDDAGRAAGRGVYFVRVSYPGSRFEDAKKMVLL